MKALIQQKKRELELIERKIDHRLQHIEDAKDSVLDQISLVSLPPLRMVRIRDSLQPKTYLDLEFPIRRLQEEQPDALVFLGKVGIGIPKEKLEQKCFSQYDLVFLLLDEEDEYYGHVETLLCEDGTHPNSAGQKLIAQTFEEFGYQWKTALQSA